MASNGVTQELAGDMIREIFRNAEEVANLHGCLTSPRGDKFRLRLLQAMEAPVDEAAIEQLRAGSRINEHRRHLNRILRFGLAETHEMDGSRQYIRSGLGEKAVNALRGLERRLGQEAAETVYRASLGPNSIRLFLRIYGDRREVDWDRLQIKYSPAEIGRLSLFLPRTIEGISAIDKLNEAELLVYKDDNHIHMDPVKARDFYQYLVKLHEIVMSSPESPAVTRASEKLNHTFIVPKR